MGQSHRSSLHHRNKGRLDTLGKGRLRHSERLCNSEHTMAPMNFFDLANLLDNDGNLQNEMMVASFAATMLATIPVLLGNEFDVNVGLKKRKKRSPIKSLQTQTVNKLFVKDAEKDETGL